MNRRRMLAAIGTGSAVALAGCLGEADTGDADPEEPTPDTPAIAGVACPPAATDLDGAVCSHTVDTDMASVYLAPSPDAATLADGRPTSEITLMLHNESSTDITFNPQSWTISRKSATGWEPLEEEWAGDGQLTVSTGDTHSWSFVEAVEAIRPDPWLDAGLYAAEIGVPDPETEDNWLACIALVRLTNAD